MSSGSILRARKQIAELSLVWAREIVAKVWSMKTADEIEAYMKEIVE